MVPSGECYTTVLETFFFSSSLRPYKLCLYKKRAKKNQSLHHTHWTMRASTLHDACVRQKAFALFF